MNAGITHEADLKPCDCGGKPVIIWHYIKGTANRINYFARCPQCKARTRYRKTPVGAVEDWNAGVEIYRLPRKEQG